MSDVRLIERWLPIAALGVESLRERTPMTPFPAPNRLHVWWARRPLVAARAAVLASLLPESADRDTFLHVLGIHGDPVKGRILIDEARRTGERVLDPYGYTRAFGYVPSADEEVWIRREAGRDGDIVVLDPAAGGGSIPFESLRLGLVTFANDLNPVAALILKATAEYPAALGSGLVEEFKRLGVEFRRRIERDLSTCFPQPDAPSEIASTYLWARTITCPHCDGLVPLSPNWKLASDGTGVRINPDTAHGPGSPRRMCRFEIVDDAADQSEGTVAAGGGLCPFPDCGRPIDGDAIKAQARSGEMGEQLFCVVVKRKVRMAPKIGKTGVVGKARTKWERAYRAPLTEDDNSPEIAAALAERLPVWEATGTIPNEDIPTGNKTEEPQRYGMRRWTELFSPRQLLGHGTAAELFRTMLEEDRASDRLNDVRRAAYVYLSLALDKLLNYNSRLSVWMSTREVVANTFNRHDFAFCWSHAEMALLIEGMGYDWAIEQTGKCISELVQLCGSEGALLDHGRNGPGVTVTCGSGDALDLTDASVDAVIMDPPYGANVMYAELSDFFYVWLKRTAGLVVPELFTRRLTDKDAEAVANKAKFKGEKGADRLATRDYQDRMASIFAEQRRVLKPDGIMTVMFTHKDTGAWDALTKGLMAAGFTITASWPVNTEAEGSLHIKDKAAANSTIFLVCRPRPPIAADTEPAYWEDVEPLVAAAVRKRVAEFQEAGITGVDLYLASFGPALEEFSKNWPLRRGQARPDPKKARRSQVDLFETFDPYEVTPEDALNAARREVKDWRLKQLTHLRGRADLDPVTSWFVLAWDAFHAPSFSYDEGLRLARAVGCDLEADIVGKLAAKKGSDLKLWDSDTRANKGTLGGLGGGRAIDSLHRVAHTARTRGLEAAREMLKDAGLLDDGDFQIALEAVLEVLPPSRTFSGRELTGDAKIASDDFDALEKLRRVAFADVVGAPDQLKQYELELAEPAA